MEGTRFDQLARRLAALGSRRQILKGLVGGGAAVAMAPHLVSAQDATPAGTPGALDPSQCAPETPEHMIALGEAWQEARKDPDQMREIFHDGVTYDWTAGDDHVDVDSYIEGLKMLDGVFDVQESYLLHVLPSGNFVTVHWEAVVVQEQDFGGFPASDQPATFAGISIFEAACGKIIRAWNVADHLGRLQQQGSLPGPAAGATPEG